MCLKRPGSHVRAAPRYHCRLVSLKNSQKPPVFPSSFSCSSSVSQPCPLQMTECAKNRSFIEWNITVEIMPWDMSVRSLDRLDVQHRTYECSGPWKFFEGLSHAQPVASLWPACRISRVVNIAYLSEDRQLYIDRTEQCEIRLFFKLLWTTGGSSVWRQTSFWMWLVRLRCS